MNYSEKYIESLDEKLYYFKHKTSLRVYVMPKKGFSKTYAIYGTKFGSINNSFVPLKSDKPIKVPDGVAHFLEHKMFEMPDGTNAFDVFSKYGANANAFTSFTNTCYLFSCTSHFEECFSHLLDYVQKPYFTKENIEKEQGIIGQEIRMYDDDSEWIVTFNMLRALYNDNPVKIDIAGTIESISKIDRDVLYNCYNTYYNPANMVCVVIGDVSYEKVFEIVDKIVCDRDNGKVESIYPNEKKSVRKKYIEANAAVSKPVFTIGFKDNYLKEGSELIKREAALNLVMKVMFGSSSDFYSENYKTGLINDTFDKDVMTEKEFSCVSLLGESPDPKLLYKNVLDTIEKYRKSGFEKSEFERIKRSELGAFIRKFNNVESIGNILCKGFLSDLDYTQFPDILKSITVEYSLKLLSEVFTEENSALSVVNPIK